MAWQDPAFAGAWDARHLSGNPARAEHLALLLEILAEAEPGLVLDLGCGSGLVARTLLERVAGLTLLGIDSSPAMLALARERLQAFGPRVRLAVPAPSLYPAFQRTRAHQGQAPNPERWDAHLEWLASAGFEAACLDVRADRGMLVARRPQ